LASRILKFFSLIFLFNNQISAEEGAATNFHFHHTTEITKVFDGGVEKKSEVIGLADFIYDVDFEKLFGWKGGEFHLHGIGLYGGTPSSSVGDLQITSNIEANGETTFKFYELFLKQQILENKLSLLFGLSEINSDFNLTDSSVYFINSSFGVNPEIAISGLNGASTYPTTALTLGLRSNPMEDIYFNVGLYDGVSGNINDSKGTQIKIDSSEGYFTIIEGGLFKSDSEMKVGLGYWSYSKKIDALNEVDESGESVKKSSSGQYIMFDSGKLWWASLFVRVGFATEKVNKIDQSLAFGLSKKGLFQDQEKDILGFGASIAQFSSHYKKQQASEGTSIEDHETALELVYRMEVKENIYIRPDLQYVINPSGSKTIDNAVVGIFRLEVAI
jgi:porin